MSRISSPKKVGLLDVLTEIINYRRKTYNKRKILHYAVTLSWY